MKKPPASSQNGRLRAASTSPRTAVRAAPVRTGSTSSAAVPPYGDGADVARAVAQQPGHERDDGERRGRGAAATPPASPSARVDPGDQRQEDQLPGRAAGGEDAGDQPAPGDEPAAGHRGHQRQRHRAGAEPDQHAPAAAPAASSPS